MFNYQCEWLSSFYTRMTNSSLGWRIAKAVGLVDFDYNHAYPEWPPFKHTMAFMDDVTREWRHKCMEEYNRIHPGIEQWIRNTTLHYGTGASFGVLASLVFLLFLFSKALPQRLKSIGYLLMLMGTSVTVWVLSFVGDIFNESVFNTCAAYWQYIVAYCVVMGLISFAVVYRLGPVTNERTLDLIKWLLQAIGLILIYNSSQIREVSITLVIATLVVYNLPRTLLINRTSRKYWNKFFPAKTKLLTEDEYVQQGNLETKKALEQLREYCRSPECQSWKIISRLKSPQRFADFIEGNSWHVSPEEMLEYDSDVDPSLPEEQLQPQNDDDDDESEMDFILSSP